jgi:hypothetical protein
VIQRKTLMLMHPRLRVLEVLSEHLWRLSHELDHIEYSKLKTRRVKVDGTIRTTQHWRASSKVHKLLRPHLDENILDWLLICETRKSAFEISWVAELMGEVAAKQIPTRCIGKINLAHAIGGRGTRITLEQTFEISNQGLRTVIGALIAKHWSEVMIAADRWLHAHAADLNTKRVID